LLSRPPLSMMEVVQTAGTEEGGAMVKSSAKPTSVNTLDFMKPGGTVSRTVKEGRKPYLSDKAMTQTYRRPLQRPVVTPARGVEVAAEQLRNSGYKV
jgi:hypothetical protein